MEPGIQIPAELKKSSLLSTMSFSIKAYSKRSLREYTRKTESFPKVTIVAG